MPPAAMALPSTRAALPGVSVALGTYNGERFLRNQLESLAGQRVLPVELVVCDDRSSDGTVAILEEFAQDAPFPVRIFRNEVNVGFTANLIGAAERCEGPLIAFCDQDDVWSERKVETCARFFADHAVRLLIHAAQPVDERLRPIGKPYPPVSATCVTPPLGADPWRMSPGFAIVLDRTLLDVADWRSRPPSRDLTGRAMDFDEWFYILAWSAGEIGFVDRSLVLYRQHGANVSGAPAQHWPTRLRKLLKEDFATHRRRASVAAAYAAFFDETSRSWSASDPQLERRLAAAAEYWRTYELLSRERDSLYVHDTFVARLRHLYGLVAAGAYRRRDHGGLGRLALVRDVRELIRPSHGANPAAA
jgi:glycosyltransferase involved in cell wall biosynthesis